MAKDKITEYDATAANNTVVGDVNLAENSALPSDMNNAVREVMSHLKEFSDGTNGIDVLALEDDDASAAIKFQAPSAVTSDTTFTLPDGDGESGQTLVTNGSGTLAWHAPYGNRNLIINGAMQVAQRGDVTGITGQSYGGPDRFELLPASMGTFTVSQSSTAPTGFKNSWKVDCTTADASPAAGDLLRVSYRIEGQDLQRLAYGTSGAKAITLSFYVRSNKTGTYNVQFQQEDNSFKQAVLSYTISSADTWEFKSITVPGDTSGVINDDNGTGLILVWVLGAGSTFTGGSERSTYTTFSNSDVAPTQTVNLADNTANEWMITGVQLEVGEQATPFEHRSYADELQRCKRFFHRWVATNNYGNIANGGVINTSQARAVTFLPVEQRTSGSFSSNGSFRFVQYGHNSSSATLSLSRGHPLTPYIQAAGSAVFQVGQFGELGADNDDDAFIDFDAEL